MTVPFAMRIEVCLPDESRSVQVARAVIGAACESVGVTAACRREIQLGLSEACTNVVRHARAGRTFQVNVDMTRDNCVVEIADGGDGFDAALAPRPVLADRESGRGLLILATVTDTLDIDSGPGRGTTVRFTKTLAFDPVPDPVGDTRRST